MAKNAVADWSTTAADNTDVGGVGITGNNLPSNLDDAIRTVMAQIAAWRNSPGFNGTLTIASASPTIILDDTDAPVQHVVGPFSSGQIFRIDVDRDNEQSGSEFRLYIDATQVYQQTTTAATFATDVISARFRSVDDPTVSGTNAFNFPTGGSKTMSRSVTSASTQLGFYNPNGLVGQVNTSASATTYQTTSDETRKIHTGYLSGADAIAVILADPVWTYDWKPEFGGTSDIGWGAQTSRAIHPSLASAPYWMDEVEGTEVPEGTEGAIYIPAGMDLGRRTPFLWAATAHLISRIEELETRLAALETNA